MTKLIDATNILQPVSGTDPTSVYFVVGIGDKIRAAVRIKHGIDEFPISFRVEGDLSNLMGAIVGAGLEDKGGTHASVHTSAPSLVAALKTVGSLLYSFENLDCLATPHQIASIVDKGV